MEALRSRSLRWRLTRVLVGLGIVSVLLLAAVNFVVVRGLLQDTTRVQLQSVRDSRSDGVDLAFARLLERTSVFGLDPAVAAALVDLQAGYAELADDPSTELDDAQLEELTAAYEPVVAPYDEVGADRPPIEDLLPRSDAGRYLQYTYVAQNDEEVRADLRDADDGTAWSAAHAEHHDYLRGLAASIGATDLLLVDSINFDIVYSVSKEVDLGTDVFTGPYADTGPGAAVARLTDVSADESVLSDTRFYLPNSSAPVVHVAMSVRSGNELVGALVLRLPTDGITDLVTSGGNWDLLGLGETGDAYIVGPDATLRTLPRSYLEDPAAFLDRFRDVTDDDRLAELIEFTGSPVLIQTVDNSVVADALAGDEALGTVDNGLGRSVIASAAPLDVGGLGWVLVTEQQTSESGEELENFIWSTLVVLAVLSAVLLVVGSILATRIAKPVRPLVGAARSIADGDYATEVPDLGRNELGDVGRQLDAVAGRLNDQEESIRAEEDRIATMLEAVLPAALVERVRSGERDLAESVDGATVVSIVVRGIPVPSAAEQDALVELATHMNEEMTALAARHGVERVKVALERQLFVAGRATASSGADAACSFALEAIELIPTVAAEQGLDVEAHAGVSSGLVASGVVGSRQVSFDIWGDAVSAAVRLAGDAPSATVVADESVVDVLEAEWPTESLGPVGGGEVVRITGVPSAEGAR